MKKYFLYFFIDENILKQTVFMISVDSSFEEGDFPFTLVILKRLAEKCLIMIVSNIVFLLKKSTSLFQKKSHMIIITVLM